MSTKPTRNTQELPGLAQLLAPTAEFYLDLHRHPALSGAEAPTAARFAQRHDADGFRVLRGIGAHSRAAELRNGEGPAVLLRAELDARFALMAGELKRLFLVLEHALKLSKAD